MKQKLEGSCLCQNIKYRFEGTLKRFFFCHCTYCQKGTGSIHVANLFSFDGKIEWEKKSELKMYKHLDTRHVRSFCSDCGSPLPSDISDMSMIKIPAGSLDTPFDFEPTAHIFCQSKAFWESDLDKVKRFAGYPEK